MELGLQCLGNTNRSSENFDFFRLKILSINKKKNSLLGMKGKRDWFELDYAKQGDAKTIGDCGADLQAFMTPPLEVRTEIEL